MSETTTRAILVANGLDYLVLRSVRLHGINIEGYLVDI